MKEQQIVIGLEMLKQVLFQTNEEGKDALVVVTRRQSEAATVILNFILQYQRNICFRNSPKLICSLFKG